ncbi:hypothetical protein M409DRAFT_65789 [Zasmidium cellare ATCC 36951]|uniref:Cytochrome P450 n=1 Tax=Zasmidium cellare ATCC 36951 TaxID=1080233 RepID=A0A6A6CPG7_ZASCE|nr:uncharacterized protein M409DRAFT_65789 [Zasmidium cellare ATCC 36951]KAF2167649.1 hypothetical protein M409DRAFT_65789 [Zasmidium cellare ATCC 36951]
MLVAYQHTAVLVALLLIPVLCLLLSRRRPYPGIPIAHFERRGLQKWMPAKFAFMQRPGELLSKASEQHPNRCFQVAAASGYKIIVPNRFANELRNHPDLDFNEATAKDFFAHYQGFNGAGVFVGAKDNIVLDTVRIKLNQNLDLITDSLVDETGEAFRNVFGSGSNESPRITHIKQHMLHIVARLSSRVFLGKAFSRHAEWLRIAEQYTVDIFSASMLLHMIPAPLQPLVCCFIPAYWRLRGHLRGARRLIEPELYRRQPSLECAEKPARMEDSLSWMEDVAQGRSFDYAAGQLGLSVAAIHTTSEMATKAVLQLCENPEVVAPLREEIINVLGRESWSKNAVAKMHLLDSFLEEVQRIHRGGIASMHRLVKRDVVLSDGFVIPRGATVLVRECLDYGEPDWSIFNLQRHMNMHPRVRFTSTSPANMGFGHGKHACPGRFFAALELKIVLCFFLLHYQVAFLPGEGRVAEIEFEHQLVTPPDIRLELRERQPEIALL